MATDKLRFNGYDSGWFSGAITDVDEFVADADGSVIAEVTKNNTALMDLTATIVVDADTVSALDIVIRARTTGTFDDFLGVELLIGGTVQGVRQDTGLLTSSFVNYTFSDVAWDADWTAAQLNGAQVRLHARQSSMPGLAGHEVDCGDVDIVFTSGAAGDTVNLPKADITVTPQIPTFRVTENPIVQLPKADITVTPQIPDFIVSTPATIVQLPKADITVTPQIPTFRATDPSIVNLPKADITITPQVPTFRVDAGNTVNLPKADITIIPQVPTFRATDPQIVDLPKADITITPQIPTFRATDPSVVQLPKADITITPQIPTFKATENPIVQLPKADITVTPFVPTFVTSGSFESIIQLPKADITVTLGIPKFIVSVPGPVVQLPTATINITSGTPQFEVSGFVNTRRVTVVS